MKKLILSAALIASTATTMFADNAVISKDGLGDFLVAPFYMAKDNICTKVTVYNTNPTHSILAKVAIREQLSSNEVDLPIFLSPGDVWTGTLCERNGDTILYSTDDSNHPSIKPILAQGKDLTKQSMLAGNVNVDFSAGYIEIYPIAEFDEGSDKKVEKSILVKRWDNLIKGQIPSNTLKTGVDGYSLAGNVAFETDGKYTTILPMKAFKGTHDKVLTGSAIAYGNDTSPDILLGSTKKYQILKLIQHKQTNFTYTNYGKDQYIVFTFPFGYNKDQVRKFELTVRDMEENKDVKQTVIFSPAPKPSSSYIKNEVAIVSVADLIAKTKNPAMFKEGQITIKDLTNVTEVQLGSGKAPSFFATLITIDKNSKNHAEVLNAHFTPVK